LNELAIENLEARIRHAQCRRDREVKFLQTFPPVPAGSAELLPPITWLQLERQLRSLAGPNLEGVEAELEILHASGRTSSPEMFYRDLLTLAWSLIDGSATFFTEEDAMD
jgi:hypothetical protein